MPLRKETGMIKKIKRSNNPQILEAQKRTRDHIQDYKKMLAGYTLWNIEKERLRVERESNRSHSQAWNDYLGMWAFAPNRTEKELKYYRREKSERYADYYTRLKRFEDWRKKHGKKSTRRAKARRQIPKRE